MKKNLLKMLALALFTLQLVALLSMGVCAEESLMRSMDVCKTVNEDMTLDGRNTKGEAWDLVDWSTSNFKQIGSDNVPAGSSTRFKAMWAEDKDNAYLYFLVEVTDNTLTATERQWYLDNIRIFLDEDGVNTDATTPVRNNASYGDIYASSEFMSYAPNDYVSKGFAYRASKMADDAGYYVEVKYTFMTKAHAVKDATIRANLTVAYANEGGANPAQFLWSFNADQWASYNNKECFVHTGTLTLKDTLVDSTEEKENPTETFNSPSIIAKQVPVDYISVKQNFAIEDAWNEVEWSSDATYYSRLAIADPTSLEYDASYSNYGFKFKTLWAVDEDAKKAYVYFLIDVNDSNLTSTKRAWASDNIRIFLDETGLGETGTLAKLNRGSAYASSEFMSYATDETSTGYKYRVNKKTDNSGYVIKVQYTLLDYSLAKNDATMRLNVVGNDADSRKDDGNTYAQQFSWSYNKERKSEFPSIDCIEHSGVLKLSSVMAVEEEVTTTKEETTTAKEEITEKATTKTEEQTKATTEPTKSGCGASIGFGMLSIVALASFACTIRKKEN